MRSSFNRRTAPKIKDGKVQRKNRQRPTTHDECIIDRESPGRGYCHVVSKRDLQAFIELIPDWHRLSAQLARITLGAPESDCDGQYCFYHSDETGHLFLHAWPKDLWMDIARPYFDAHEFIFKRLGVSHDLGEDTVTCRFTENQARAFMLLHVFLHELGHHYDRSNQKHLGATKGEDYAERFANSRFEQLYPEYVRTFGDPSRE